MELQKDRRVDVRIEGDKIRSVRPATAIVDPAAGVAWDVAGLPSGYTVEIDFRVQDTASGVKKGPFPPGKAARVRGRYLASVAGPIDSNPSDQKEGVWKYDVILRNGDGADVDAIDPSIIIRE